MAAARVKRGEEKMAAASAARERAWLDRRVKKLVEALERETAADPPAATKVGATTRSLEPPLPGGLSLSLSLPRSLSLSLLHSLSSSLGLTLPGGLSLEFAATSAALGRVQF